MEKEHAELAPSDADRWVNCPGSIFLRRNITKVPAGPDADRGTHVHELCAVRVQDFLQHKIDGSDPDIRATLMEAGYEPDEIENAKAYRDIIWEEILGNSITNKAWGVEDKFTLDEKLQIFGTVDFWSICIDDRAKRAAAIVDYKNGFNYVSEKSGQLKTYACALRREIRGAGKDIDYVRLCIYQPNCVSAEAFRSTTLTAKQLDIWEKKVYKAAHQIYVKQKPKFKCGDWCKWCQGKAVCTSYNKEIETTMALKIAEPEKIVLPAPETLDDERLAKIILNASLIEEFLKACKTYGLNRHLSGKPLPGVKAVLGTQRRKWIENEVAVAEGLIKLGLARDSVYQEPPLITITTAEKKLGKNKLNGLTTMSDPKPVLVPETDPRVAVVNGLDLLEAIESDE